MDKSAKIYLAGHRGLVGQALYRGLQSRGYSNILVQAHTELDLCDQQATQLFFKEHRPEFVILAAARVGGIQANALKPANFIYENLAISLNAIESARVTGVKKLLYLGSSCIYPKMAQQPIQENSLLTGPLEPTNEPYAIAKIAGLKLCESYNRQYGTDYMSVMPTNLYGPGDNFNLETSHVLPALLRKCHEAKKRGDAAMTVWGSGTPRREFLHVDDLADACIFLMQEKCAQDLDCTVNIGTGEDITIRALAELIQEVVAFEGRLEFDASKPDGTPRKQLNVDVMKKLGWQAKRSLRSGIQETYEWFLKQSKY